MSDEDLRALERAAASDEHARLRLAEAVLKTKGATAALRILQPLCEKDSEASSLARRRALQITISQYPAEAGPNPAQAFAKLFGERLSSIDEVTVMLKETPVAEMAIRVILVRALRGRSKRASIALAKELPDSDPLKSVLAAEGEIVI